jgi:hypothetical protein
MLAPIIVIILTLTATVAWAMFAPIRCSRCRGSKTTQHPDEHHQSKFICFDCGNYFDVRNP